MTRTDAKRPNAAAKSTSKPGAHANQATHTKTDKVIALLARKDGATLSEITDATGWQARSARAALTGLKKKGHDIRRERRDGVSYYHLTPSA